MMERRHFIKTMLILAGGAMLPISALKAKPAKVVIWGQKPFPTPDALRRICVRRTVLYIEKCIKQMMISHRWELNDQITRNSMVGMANSVCLQLKQKGAHIYDYSTICDPSNNTPEMVDRHEVRLDLHLKFSPAIGETVKISFWLRSHKFDVTKKII